jgi:hypothetical protein
MVNYFESNMINRGLGFYIILLLIALRPQDTIAQNQIKPYSIAYWGSFGLGFIAMNDASEGGFGGGLRVLYGWDNSSVSASIQGGGTIHIFGTNDEATVLNVCYGRLIFADSWIFRFAAGPAYLNRTQRYSGLFSGSGTNYNRYQFGISGEAEALYHSGIFGIGMSISAAASRDITVGTMLLTISMGKFE